MPPTSTEDISAPQSILVAENRDLRAKLEAVQEMLRAIRADEVDALVTEKEGAPQVRTLGGADVAYRTFVEVMCQGAATIAADGTVLYCNRHFAELLRSPFEKAVGASIYDFAAAGDEGALRALLWEGLATSCMGKPFRLRGRDGSSVSTVITATPLSVDGIACVCLVLADLTEHEARIAAEAASRAKDRFLAALSHELRTPLTPVVMVVAAMEADTTLPQQVREDLAMVRRNVELETRLIDDLLDLSRVISGKLHLRAEPVSLKSLVKNVLEMVKSDVNQKSLAVHCQWIAKADRVHGDPVRLQQVIWNLIKNAIKFGKERGKIYVRLSNPDEQMLQLEIQDDGIGIQPSALPNVFNAFEQGDENAPRQAGGLGLGLAIAKAVVEMHGGSIRAESAGLGTGATMSVLLPVTAQELAAAPSADPEKRIDSDGSSFRVLLVEDHHETATILARLLRQYGHKVTIANTIASALQYASAEPFDIVISDIGLPDGTGHDLMKQIKERHSIPGVALTGYGMENDLRRSSETGFAEHVVKPVNIPHLQSVIRRVARSK
jgi:PAS domain S-box-containing protein